MPTEVNPNAFVRRTHDASATVAAFPLGGIGTGNVSVGSRGEFRDWEISNHPDKGTWLPFTFFAIRAELEGAPAISRVLESRPHAPHEGDSGYHIGKVAGLPRLATSRMSGEYPVLEVSFQDETLPVDVVMTAFTPLVPLDPDDSGIPGAVLRYAVTNSTSRVAEVSIAGSMSNPIAIDGHDVFQFPRYRGAPSVRFRKEGGLSGLEFGTDLADDDTAYGSAVLATSDDNVTAIPQWPVNFWQDGVQLFWDEFRANGVLTASDVVTFEDESATSRLPQLRVGSLNIAHSLQPGESRDFEFYLTWHTPNRSRAWNGMVGMPNTNAAEIVKNHYAARYDDAWAVATDLSTRLSTLENATRAFTTSVHGSSLPDEVIDAVSSTLVALRSTTCFRLDNGTADGIFAAWEGSFDHAGSCEGTCTHVWNYAQTVANLYPSLERNARRNEFINETLPDGRMRFRSNSVFGGEPLEFHPAVDGQMGTIVRLYREWQYSGDDEFLSELWPHAKRALDYAFTTWDSNGDLVLDSQQHNTYDIEFYGENSLANSMFIAALKAAAAMGAHLGDTDTAERYATAAVEGAKRMDAMLFNGEYYDQRLDNVDAHRYQYGTGCLSDQLLGQTLAHLTGLGHILPADHVSSAISAVYRHNYRTGFEDYNSVQRTYALNDESGLVLCSWPNGGRPRIPFVYSDEVWTGIEYQVATHLIYEGFVDEGLTIVRAVRDRYDGVKRNPWNEVECGNHYVRSMASWGVLLALTGVRWSAPAGTLHLAPSAALFDGSDVAEFIVSTGSGWGRARFDNRGAILTILGGALEVTSLTAEHPRLGSIAASTPLTIHVGQSATLVPTTVTTASPTTTHEE